MPRHLPSCLQPSSADAGAIAEAFKAQGVMRVAALDDGSAWCLVAPEHLANIRVGGWVVGWVSLQRCTSRYCAMDSFSWAACCP